MKIEELLKLADEQIHYPFEKVIEHYFPLADTLTDYVCVCAVILEDAANSSILPADKKAAIMDGLFDIWKILPLSPALHAILDPIFNMAMSILIDTVVAWLNHILPDHGWVGMSLSPDWYKGYMPAMND